MLLSSALSFTFGSLLTAFSAYVYHRRRYSSYEKLKHQMLHKAEKEIQEQKHKSELALQQLHFEQQKQVHENLHASHIEIEEDKKRLEQKHMKATHLVSKNEMLSIELAQKTETLKKQQEELIKQKQSVLEERSRLITALENISNLSQKEAEKKLYDKISLQVKKDCALWGARYLKEKKKALEKDATKLIAGAIHRLASSCTSRMTLSTLSVSHEEMKSRIIGKEGRNIHFLENLLGVNILVDETPKTVLISGLDPLRKAIAKETLKRLLKDGRIYPTRIQEEYESSKPYIEQLILEQAEDKALKLGITQLDPHLLQWMARLYLMDSLSQNLLEHSYQVGLILGMIAQELHLDVSLARRIGFLHDIGKAAPPEMEGTHALIGQKIALQYGESKLVANGIGCHHNEVVPLSIEGSLCAAADTISASRPGARSESLHHYIKRVQRLEEIATSFPEVEKAYALQSGKEIRVITIPEKVDDASLSLLAQSLAHKVEKELELKHSIKISVMREHQVIEYTR